jgi:hypothetical protein
MGRLVDENGWPLDEPKPPEAPEVSGYVVMRLEDELTRLRSERDALEYDRDGYKQFSERLRSDLQKAKEALKPFVDEWNDNWTGYHYGHPGDDLETLDDMCDTTLTVGHLRTAARILLELENSK